MNKKLIDLINKYSHSATMNAEYLALEAYELGKKEGNREYYYEEAGDNYGMYFSIIKNHISVEEIGWKHIMTKEQAEKIAQYYVDVMNGDVE